MFEIKVLGRPMTLVVLAMVLCIPQEANGAKGALAVYQRLDGTYHGLYLKFHGIEYRESKTIKYEKDPTIKFFYIRTDKTEDELKAAVKDFQSKFAKAQYKNLGPLLKKLGYNVKSKDDMLLFSNVQEKKDFEQSQFSWSKAADNEWDYNIIKEEGIKVAFAREPAPGRMFFRNPQETAKGKAAADAAGKRVVRIPVNNALPLLQKLGWNVRAREADLLYFPTTKGLKDFQKSYIPFAGDMKWAYDILKEEGYEVEYATQPGPATMFLFRNPQDKEKALALVQARG